jgi:tetratricopeptide (TPR) repeat protein
VHRSNEETKADTAPKRRRAKPAGAKRAGRVEPARAAVSRSSKGPAKVEEAVIRAAKALERGYEREALRILRPLRDTHPGVADVRELLGLALYRSGRWAAAAKELDAYNKLTGSTDEHPVLMDCARAQGRYRRVGELWEELRAASPGADIVTEGRIVAAGALADQGKLPEAIHLLERGPLSPKRIGFHHLRLWYALADLQERAGNLPAARSLFRRVSSQDPAFFDVAERLAALG